MKLARHLPSPAMIIACLALAVALGGTGYAAISLPANSVGAKQLKKNSVSSPKVKDNSIRGGDVLESSLSQVPQAANADKLDNVDSAGFVRTSSSEAWHEIGATGEPAFMGAWHNEAPSTETTAAYYKDPLDVVHLKGVITDGTGAIFTLPTGYRPSKYVCLVTNRQNAAAYICLNNNGILTQFGGGSTGFLLLDGLTFRINS